MLREAISGTIGLSDFITYAISAIVVIFLTMPVHEFAHAFAANKLGDPTAKYLGRLSINPLKHIDWVGAACILLFGFGWAKPVPINSRYFRRGKTDVAITAFAGPLSNLVVAFAAMLLMFLFAFITGNITLVLYTDSFPFYVAMININLAVFNLVPIPPLDGSKILAALLPNNLYYKLMRYERYFSIILMILLYTGILLEPLSTVSQAIYGGFFNILSRVFTLFI